MKAKQDKPFMPLQLRKARRMANLSQLELAEKIDVHRNTIIRWESPGGDPSALQAEALAHALGQPAAFFYEVPPEPKLAKHQDVWTNQTSLEKMQELIPVALKRLRHARDITINDIAFELKIPQATLWDWAKARSKPTEEEIALLRFHYGKDFDPTPVLARSANISVSQRLDRIEKLLTEVLSVLKKANLMSEENS